ncbi:DUF1292 domain-containing protein [Clostridium cochlearium]|jgi:uncharacterized protein YrzB (UPF0473 family)|uniref:UPF0473 protein HMJ28_08995 n=1 Tax=Clostridium cochlearium TaxID=1494 RepID=A0A239ZRB6_CLOCO|nr:DUF1292 domain-containing protein [Clostridium cochlearium]MBV1816937.1 DUF1292 domain-containing protein [Bacteroidales bacterium MSK.15.36]NSJ90731.1 DUF1292 domain-containing protein [Coprococcus sp. MSK.21.13]MBE6064171.1 DUF1292 domain-containing protein [Clostridium cochlearium]MCG4571073.1 DUF1292 domain-containing protein [Clostridium cochlearium]MCG4578887.1 DUF1292 domain-containing protein [Clostridium cochlearium]
MENDVTHMTLIDEDGKEIDFEVITKLDIEENEYVIVVPENEDTDEAMALKIDIDDEGNDVLSTIDDDEEFALVLEAYETLFNEEGYELN